MHRPRNSDAKLTQKNLELSQIFQLIDLEGLCEGEIGAWGGDWGL
jgi:hypothetical protein